MALGLKAITIFTAQVCNIKLQSGKGTEINNILPSL